MRGYQNFQVFNWIISQALWVAPQPPVCSQSIVMTVSGDTILWAKLLQLTYSEIIWKSGCVWVVDRLSS